MDESDLEKLKIYELTRFLKEKRVQLLENIAEYPLLFVEDYNNQQNAIIDTINNHETSLPLQDGDDEDAEDAVADDEEPRAKRRRIESRLMDWNREGIG